MFSKVHVVTQPIYLMNLIWMFTTLFIPVATAWTARGPEIFYAIVYILWKIAYLFLTHKVIMSEEKYGYQKSANDVRNMRIYRQFIKWQIILLTCVIWTVIIIFYSAAQMAAIIIMLLFVGAAFNDDSDKLFVGEKDHQT